MSWNEVWSPKTIEEKGLESMITTDYITRMCSFGDIGALNYEFNRFNSRYGSTLGYTKNFCFKPGTSEFIRTRMKDLLLLNDKKKSPARIFSGYTNDTWLIRNLRDSFYRVEQKLQEIRYSGFKFTDFEEEVKEIPNRFKASMAEWNKSLDKMGGKVSIVKREASPFARNDTKEQRLVFVFNCLVPDVKVNVYNIENKLLEVLPLNGDIQVAVRMELKEVINNYGSIQANSTVRSRISPYFTARHNAEKGIHHPFLTSRTSEHTICAGDLQSTLNTAFNNFQFPELVMNIVTWLSNFQVGRTYPLNPINEIFYGLPEGMDETFVRTVGQSTTRCANRILATHNTSPESLFKTFAKVCDDNKCTLKEKCREYPVWSDPIEQKAQTDRIERRVKVGEWIDKIFDKWNDLIHMDEDTEGELWEIGVNYWYDAMDKTCAIWHNEKNVRSIFQVLCTGLPDNNARPAWNYDWSDIYVILRVHPEVQIDRDADTLNPDAPYDSWQWANLYAVENGNDNLMRIMIEAFDIYHDNNTESISVDSIMPEEVRLEREMVEWAAAHR